MVRCCDIGLQDGRQMTVIDKSENQLILMQICQKINYFLEAGRFSE